MLHVRLPSLPVKATRPLAVALTGMLCGALLTGCGGGADGTDLKQTCTAVRRAFPATIYDDHENAVFARKLGKILDAAQPKAARRLDPLAQALAAVVAAAGDNDAVVTANVQLLAAIDEVNRSCRAAGAQPVRR